MLKLKKTIDFNLLGDESEAHMGGSGVMDLDDDLSEETSPSPPPLKLARINISHCSDLQSSPPCSTPLSRLGQFFSSPSPPQQGARTSRLFFKPLRKSISKLPDCKSSKVSGKSVGSVNRNPFTPGGHSHTLNRKRHFSRYSSTPALKNNRKLETSFNSDSEDESCEASPVKRIRVADFSVTNSRYEEEFLEISEIASGEFGCVKRARHRLDGVDYAVKISKKNLDSSPHQEKMALNEVFAHAALIKHKHFVRYYSSWVEGGHVYIQNEFCRGGSLSQRLQEMRTRGQRFSEAELRRMMVQILKGLQYIHNKDLVHLDVKPDNILLASEGGAQVDYKIGDLGHVAHIMADNISPEEGDCRYMAPEFLQMTVDPQLLFKADIFSLGLSLYEAASLCPLPRNSYDSPSYESMRRGCLPHLPEYSSKLNSILQAMTAPDISSRPDAAQLLADTQPRCHLLQEWEGTSQEAQGDHRGEHSHLQDSKPAAETDTSDDTSLEEITDTELSGDHSKLELIKAQEKIFDLEKELKTKDVQVSKVLNDSLKVVDSMKESNIGDDEKVEKYETLLKQIKQELQSIR